STPAHRHLLSVPTRRSSDLPEAAMAARPGQLALQPVLAATAADPGCPDPANAPSLIDALLLGAEGCLEGGYDGLVTGPVQKAARSEEHTSELQSRENLVCRH